MSKYIYNIFLRFWANIYHILVVFFNNDGIERMEIHYKILSQIKYVKYRLASGFADHKITPQLDFLVILIDIKIVREKVCIR